MNLTGKIALVTGANAGIGLEACVKIAKAGATLYMVARDAKRGAAAVEQVKRRSGNQQVSLLLCDFASQKSIRAHAAEVLAKLPRLDLLVNNAGLVSDTRQVTEDGFERTFAVNHLGYFLLTNLLLDRIVQSAPARIVNVASAAHFHGDMDFENLQYEKGGYFVMRSYARSKLGNVLFTAELARRLEGKRVTVNSLHPGAVATEIWNNAPWYAKPLIPIARLFMLSVEEGGDRIVQLAMDPALEGLTGGYYQRRKLTKTATLARDEALAKRLWDVSAQLVKL